MRKLFCNYFSILFSTLIFLFLNPEIFSADNITERKRISNVVKPTNNFYKAERYERYPGGSTTIFKKINRNSFSNPSANMKFNRQIDFHVGNGLFRKLWVSSPASTISSDGLGPLFNARSCQNCHLKDGRGHTPSKNWPFDDSVSMLLRLSIPPQNKRQEDLINKHKILSIQEPKYGNQLQDLSIQGHDSEGKLNVKYEEIIITLSGGEKVSLRKPTYKITNLNYGEPHKNIMISPRIAPPMIGLGLLEAIDEKDILSNADQFDLNHDGISGKPNFVWDKIEKKVTLGKFGWKAGEPNLIQQSSEAFKNDIGISSQMNNQAWGDCTILQDKCRSAPNGNSKEQGSREISNKAMNKLIFYVRNLGVPTRRNIDNKKVLNGKKIFYESKCINCHIPKYVTKRDPELPEQSFQLIWPYTDLLLHDMGDGLADNRPEGAANGKEWRTPPLWGIGLTKIVNGHTEFLHDGRARNLLEAIIWHGGEAELSKQKIINLNKNERSDLIAFLNSL